MRIYAARCTLFFLLAIRYTLYAVILLVCIDFSYAAVPEAHKVCTSCHIEEGPPKLKAGINDTCVRCHPPHPGKDHPVGGVSEVVPEKLPLDSENRITCITCHEPHGKATVGKLLRMEFNELCVVCHKS